MCSAFSCRDDESRRAGQLIANYDRDIDQMQAVAGGGTIESAVFHGLAVCLGEIWP